MLNVPVVRTVLAAPMALLLVLGVACGGSASPEDSADTGRLTDPVNVPTSTRIAGGVQYTFNSDGISVEGASRTATPGSAVPSAGTSYTVVSGDTCGAIATRFEITLAELRAANILINAECTNLRTDDVLRIPAGAAGNDSTPSSGGTTDGSTHTIAAGQNCGEIADLNHITLDALLGANGMTEDDCRSLQIGQVLQLP